MRPGKLAEHLKRVHPEHAGRSLDYFIRLKENTQKTKRSFINLFKVHDDKKEQLLKASYELSFLIAKKSRPHTDGEQLLKPAIETYLRTVQGNSRAHQELDALHLSNDTVRRRLDGIATDIKIQLVTILRNTKFSLALDETTVCSCEALLLAYVRFQYNSEFMEEMLFCESLQTTTTAKDIYNVVKQFMTDNDIPLINLISIAADGAPNMIGRNKGVLKLLKDDQPDMMAVHCIIHRENLAAATLSPQLDEILKKVVKVINYIKSRPKTERLFKQFCQEMNEEYVRVLLHTQVRWLSKRKCLERFVSLYDTLLEFGEENVDFQFMKCKKAKALIFYLADIYGKLNVLNKELQGKQKTLIDCKTKIFAFINKLLFLKGQISRKTFTQFYHLGKCDPSDEVLQIISVHLSSLHVHLNDRFLDLKKLEFPIWITQPFLLDIEKNHDLDNMSGSDIDEFMDLQNDESAKAIFAFKQQLMWLDQHIASKYNKVATKAQHFLLPFPTTYLVESAFSAVADIVCKKRGRLNICDRGDLRTKLTSFVPRYLEIVSAASRE